MNTSPAPPAWDGDEALRVRLGGVRPEEAGECLGAAEGHSAAGDASPGQQSLPVASRGASGRSRGM